MAHTCPECGNYCTCNGDWDDTDMGENTNCSCECWKDIDNDDDFDEGEFFSYTPSGLKCKECDSTDALRCVIEDEEGEHVEHYCGEHAAKAGYCCGCGTFCAGLTEFEFKHPGFCEHCWAEVDHDY